ncbi:transferase [Proteus mirabilis]|uniref:transferase n=1 Tax=Proteus mirabilis TaxID=584 RepID=UPI002182115D|nr:transferase [Proteus mirabilis]MCT0123997.1 transferase [Proteus mirabilis]MDF7337071.1 transferase [Proteus mirabilis]
MKKYKITSETKEYNGVTLYRIRRVYTDSPGGWIENESNLSRDDNCFIFDNVMVFGNAKVTDNAIIRNNVKIYGNAIVKGNSKVKDNAEIYGNVLVEDNVTISDDVVIYDNAVIKDNAKVSEYAIVRGDAIVEKNGWVTGYATVEGNTIVSKGEIIKSQFGSWDDIDELRAFYIYINRYNSTATAYVNGRHQVPITIYIEALDKNGRIIKIAKEDIYRNTHIVNEKNLPIDRNVISLSDKENGFVFPSSEEATLNSPDASTCVIYLSVNKVIDTFRICAQTHIKGKEYTTAFKNNYSDYLNFIILDVAPKKIFTEADVDIEPLVNPRIEKDVETSGDVLTKYYLRFNGNNRTITKSVEYEENKSFHYFQKGHYQIISTSTDKYIKKIPLKPHYYYTKEFHFKPDTLIPVTSANDEDGVCFWSYSIEYGKAFTSSRKDEEMNCIIYDQYGNDLQVSIKADENNKLKFYFGS